MKEFASSTFRGKPSRKTSYKGSLSYLALVMLIMFVLSIFPSQTVYATPQAPGFYVELSKLRVISSNDGNGDDPYFVVIGFRSRYRTPNSTQTIWNGALYEIASDIENYDPNQLGSGERFINPDMGRVELFDVNQFTFEDAAYGQFPEVLGALVIAMDSDACDFEPVMRAAFTGAKNALHDKLKELIEDGGINPTDLDKAALSGIAGEIQARAAAAGKDAADLGNLGCLIDEDDTIDYHLFLYLPADPSVSEYIPQQPLDSKVSWGIVDNQANQMHEFEISGGNPIVFEGKDAKYEATVTVGGHTTVSHGPMIGPKSSQTISRLFLPYLEQAGVRSQYAYTTTPISVLQYNVQFLTPWNTGALPDHWPNTDDRAQAIAKEIACYDIVALEETINDARRATILQAINEAAANCGKADLIPGAPYFAYIDGPDVPESNTSTVPNTLDSLVTVQQRPEQQQGMPLLGDEVTLISRYPIVESNAYIFKSRANEDALVAKGVIYAQLQTGPEATDRLDVFATHLQSGNEDAKLGQVLELATFMGEHTDPGIPVLLLGDFNIDGGLAKQQTDSYLNLINTIGLLPSGVILADLGRNLNESTNRERNERIDYIFASNTGFSPDSADVRVLNFDGNGWGTLSDHAGVAASLMLQKATLLPPVNRPDLVATQVQITSTGVQVTIKNIGDAPVLPGDNFWVDLYINPRTLPTSVNQIWQDMSDSGLAWAVLSSALPLPPGAQITLDLTDPYFVAERSHFPNEIPAGSQIFVQVDSANSHTGYGGVLESHEETNQPYNNFLALTLPETVTTDHWATLTASMNPDEARSALQTVMLTAPRP